MLQRIARSARLAAAWLDARQRPLPRFLVIGTQRGGTTSFYDALTRHPRVAPALVKEVHYFDLGYERGESWYRAHFPRLEVGGSGWTTTGEATPSYLWDPRVPARVRTLLPGVGVLALLRDPVDRAWSHYQRERRLGREDLSFEEAVAREEERLASEADDYTAPHHRFHSYLDRGRYATQLERWRLQLPPERMLVMRSEDFYQRPDQVLQRAFAFLDLPPFEPKQLRRLQEGSGKLIDPGIRARLRVHFSEEMDRLAEEFGADLRWSE
jgi:hypothetical protein